MYFERNKNWKYIIRGLLRLFYYMKRRLVLISLSPLRSGTRWYIKQGSDNYARVKISGIEIRQKYVPLIT